MLQKKLLLLLYEGDKASITTYQKSTAFAKFCCSDTILQYDKGQRQYSTLDMTAERNYGSKSSKLPR